MHWYLDVLKKYVDFNGRARRQEYWMYFLFNVIISLVVGFVDGLIGTKPILGGLYILAVILPSICVGIRRLHDTNRSGLWLLVGLIPCIGWIALLVFYIQDSDAGANQFGPNPKAAG